MAFEGASKLSLLSSCYLATFNAASATSEIYLGCKKCSSLFSPDKTFTCRVLTGTLETQEYRSINVYKMATSSDGQIIATQPEVTLLISRRRSLNIFS